MFLFVLKRCQGVIVLGIHCRPISQSVFQWKKIYIVPNRTNYSLNFSVKNNSPLKILYLANLQASKGIEDLIDAVAILCKEGKPDFKVDVVGRGEKRHAYPAKKWWIKTSCLYNFMHRMQEQQNEIPFRC